MIIPFTLKDVHTQQPRGQAKEFPSVIPGLSVAIQSSMTSAERVIGGGFHPLRRLSSRLAITLCFAFLKLFPVLWSSFHTL
jgi:hypothetical protein